MALFMGLAKVFVDGGMAAALIQRSEITRLDESTVFWFNLATGFVAAACLCLGAPWIAKFYDLPILTPIARVFALQFVIASLNSRQNTLFTRRLDFKTPFIIQLISIVVGAAIAVPLALNGFGVCALVSQSMTYTVMRTIMIWSLSPWRPMLVCCL